MSSSPPLSSTASVRSEIHPALGIQCWVALSHLGRAASVEETRPLKFSFNLVVRLCSVDGVAGGLG